MAFGIYKQGQGYWVRMLSAVFMGTLFLAGAAWLYGEGQKIADALPRAAVPVNLVNATGQLPPVGDTVRFLEPDIETGGYTEIATATVKAHAPDGKLHVDKITDALGDAIAPDKAQRIEATNGFSADANVLAAIRMFDPIYLQGALAALAIIIGALAVYFYIGVHKKTSDFLIATDVEMRRVNWSTRKDVIRSTIVVIVASFGIAASLFVVDLFFQWFFSVLQVRSM